MQRANATFATWSLCWRFRRAFDLPLLLSLINYLSVKQSDPSDDHERTLIPRSIKQVILMVRETPLMEKREFS